MTDMQTLAPFTLHRAGTAAQAAALLASLPGARLLAGGTDLLPNLRRGLGSPAALVDISGVADIAAVSREAQGWRLGAGVTLARLAADPAIAQELPALAQAAASVAGPGHRNVATLGGNLCLDTRCVYYNQSEWWRRSNDYCLKHGGDTCHVAPQGRRCHAAFSGDVAPALIALDAAVRIVGARGERTVPLVDLSAIAGFDTIDAADDGATSIGAGVTLARLVRDDALARRLPVLREAAASVAGPAHRSVATVGGNLCLDTRCVFYNQSAWWRRANAWCLKHGGDTCHVAPQGNHCHAAFAGDLAPALIALGAAVEVAGPAGTRRLPLEALYVDDGAAHLALARGELVARVHIPAQPAGARSAYRKVRVRGAIDFPLAGIAARLVRDRGRVADLRVAITGTNSRPLLLAGTATFAGASVDEALLAALAKLVQKQVSPMRTTLTASNWRRTVAAVTARRLVADLAA